MARGIPDRAWDPIEGDDRKIASALKKRNKSEARQRSLPFSSRDLGDAERDAVTRAITELETASDASIEALAQKESQWDRARSSEAYQHQKFVADAWCATFVWPKQPGEFDHAAPTNELWRQLRDGERQPPTLTAKTVGALGEQYSFFHWHLQFPHVFARGGFDLVLGNPPWVRQELLALEKRLLSLYSSYTSTADSSVYFLERGVQISRPSGFVAMLTPNKWFRAAYAEELRSFVRQRCRVVLVVDFGHSRTLFPDADTFPALVAFRPVSQEVGDDETASFVRAYDSDLRAVGLHERVSTARVTIAHRNLRRDRWQLEENAVGLLLERLLRTGQPLESVLPRPVLRGLLTGFNDAFYVNSQTRDGLIAIHPACEVLFKKMIRGRDIKRWRPEWAGMWHIVIPSSQNKIWPWSLSPSENEAEQILAQTYPAVHGHLKKFEDQLRARQDRGTFWWELRACDFYDVFEAPKIVVQCIAYYSQFALDAGRHVANNKVLIIPSDDLYLLSVLNSRVIWWVINRTFQHMKDEGLSVDVQFLKKLPIPNVSPALRSEIHVLAQQIFEAPSVSRAPLEVELDRLVMRAFDLTPEEESVLVESLPPRDPIESLSADSKGIPQEGATTVTVAQPPRGATVIPLPATARPSVPPPQSDPHRELPAWASSLLPAVAAKTGLNLAGGSWATSLSGHDLGIAALAAVLRNLPGPSSREDVERAVILAVLPGLLQSKFDEKMAAAWRQAIGAANTALTSIAALSIPWGEVMRRAVIEGVLHVSPQGRWSAGPDVHDAPSPQLDARAIVSLSWLATLGAEDQHLTTQLGVLRVA